ncbi:hypothetical protein [Actinoplanes derwentensis]|uniref:Lipoprotein LprG n=1 Tax=Actinoplanes derwentensis TaxID=113562 RepID=A0A1H2ARZ3_9ACTN|nr:hypothetical protein [Actinoplanes derwentensis]GID84355.1 hypothetical protein Ade03nite_32790 [Actinoplanes derwentensis]SDT48738.1 hypothetical protein SAMN04489716_4054 [Actinoplanes derwentensis]
MRFSFGMAALLLVAGCQAPPSPEPVPSPSPAVTASANGIEALEAAAILERAGQSLRKAPSFRFTSSAAGRTVDLRIAGNAARGTVVLDDERTEWLVVDGQRYLKGDERFWSARFSEREAAAGREIVGDRWMLVPPTLDSRAISKDFTVGELLDTTFATEGPLRKEPKAGMITLTDGGGAEVSVAATGEPYPVGWSRRGESGTITEVGVPVPNLTAPGEDDVFDLITLVESGMLTEL